MLLANHLDLRDNTTCYLYTSVDNLQFYTVDVQKLAEDTPLGEQRTLLSLIMIP